MLFISRISIFLTLIAALLVSFSFAQNHPEPRKEQLLNDLKVLIWNKPGSEKVSVKLRIHSGAAFDPKDKMGTMALLSDILFPDDGIRKFFEEDLEGNLEVTTTYDYIQIDVTAKNNEFLTVLETLAPAIINPTIDKETTGKVKARRLEKLKKLKNNPSYLAKRSVSQNLLGDYPYGRPIEGTSESLAKIDFADLIFAKQRFLASDNATLTVEGDVRSSFVYRAARRHFGGWGKRTEKIPASFRLPGDPGTETEMIRAIGNNEKDFYFALNGFARDDKDYYASKVLENILRKRMKGVTKIGGEKITDASLYQTSHLLRGLYFLKYRSNSSDVSKTSPSGNLIKSLLIDSITRGEFESAKQKAVSKVAGYDHVNFWLDLDTFGLKSIRSELKKSREVTLADVTKVAAKLTNEPVTSAVVLFHMEEENEDTNSLKQDSDPPDPKK